MKRGTIFWVNLEAVAPPETGKTRPAIVVSNSNQNFVRQSVVVVPLSSQAPEIWPLRLGLGFPRGKTPYAVLPGIRQVSKRDSWRVPALRSRLTWTGLMRLSRSI